MVSAADTYSRSTANATLFSKAREASKKRLYDQAISLLREIVETDPGDFLVWLELGTMYFIQKSFAEAETAFTEALQTHPDYAVALISLGRLRIAQKNFNGTIDPALVIDRSTFREPQLISEGIKRVFVNGVEVWSDGAVTGKRPGRALRHL